MAKPKLPQQLDNVIYANLAKSLGSVGELKPSLNRVLSIMDQQEFVNRFKWYNLPQGLDAELLERILYYRGKLMFFYLEADHRFMALPFALYGGIDMWGRYNEITPVPFNGSTDVKDPVTGKVKTQAWIPGLKREVAYDILLNVEEKDLYNKCVILQDRSLEISQEVQPRWTLAKEIINVESDIIPFMRTALLNSTGINGMRLNSEDEQAQVKMQSASIYRAALAGERWVGMVGLQDFQELSGGNVAKAEEFLEVMQALDNFRKSTLGIDNGGLFQKKAHMLQSEQEASTGQRGYILNDSLTTRRKFCNIVNSIWGLDIWVEPNEVEEEINKVEEEQEPKQEGEGTPEGEGGQDE